KVEELRRKYEENLKEKGLQIEHEPKEESQDQKTCFVKVHVPWEILLRNAERMKMKMPLKEEKVEEQKKGNNILHRLRFFKNVKNEEPDYYTSEFVRDKMDFFDIKDEKTFFTNSQRSRIAYRLMSETRFGTKRIDIGINNLIGEGGYLAAFPLHEGKHKSSESKIPANANLRRLLYWEWARWGRWYKFQPLDLIRLYLGDKVAIYFAWLGFYTEALFYPTFVGFIVFIYSIIATYPTYAGNLTMCPLCDEDCSYWKLKTSSILFRPFQQVKEHTFTLKPYKNKCELKLVFVAFLNLSEPIALQFLYMFAIIVYRLAISAIFAVSIDLSSLGAIGTFATPAMLTTITASLLSLIVIMLLNKVYEKVALWLTELELPRTQTEFEDRFTFKMFCFQFVNFYSYLFYIAFFKSTITGSPGNYNYLFGEWRWEECDAGGCMYELSIQLIIIMFGKQLWNNIVELVLPWAQTKYRQWKSQKVSAEMKDNEYTRWEQDYDLNQFKEMDLFYEYLEMVIQFGFVTLFVAAFPLAPVLALINNIIEIRLDANKFICELRRPLAHKCSDIGAWYYLLEFIGNLAVVTNAFTIAITSEAIPKLVYYYVYSLEIYPESTYGYVNNSMSYFNTSDFDLRSVPNNRDPFGEGNVTVCRYPGYLSPPNANPPYAFTTQYWHNIAGKLAFIIVVEVSVSI
uniref:Anoctamin n=1 Tax=Ciona savignyi TaxID=51511 RepID=H2YZM2_CIOSA